MNDSPVVFILLLNWNGWRDTHECIVSLKNIEYLNCKLLVVDNDSVDDSVSILKSLHPDLDILSSPSNLGFGGGNNLGIEYAISRGADYIWILNNDTVVSSNALTELVKAVEDDKTIGAVGSSILDFDFPHNIQAWGGGRVSFFLGSARNLRKPGNINYITGASLLVRTSVLEEIKGFDEAFFMYWEDVDMSLRIQSLGWKITVADMSRVYHKESVSLGKKSPSSISYYNYSAVKFFKVHSKISYLPIVLGSIIRFSKRIFMSDWIGAKIVVYKTIEALRDEK